VAYLPFEHAGGAFDSGDVIERVKAISHDEFHCYVYWRSRLGIRLCGGKLQMPNPKEDKKRLHVVLLEA
jgi:hypothetical protein